MDTVPFDLGRGAARLETMRTLLDNTGRLAQGILRVAADVVDDQTVTIGTDVFEVDIIDSDSGQETVGAMTDAQTFMVADAGVTGWAVGDVLELETEYVLITDILTVGDVSSGERVEIIRGWGGSTAATHVATTTINESDTIPTDKISVPMAAATLTPTAFTDVLVAIINSGAVGFGTRFVSDKQSGLVAAKGTDDNTILLIAKGRGVLALATTETLGGGGNAFDAATMADGVAASRRKVVALAIVPIAAEVTKGDIHIPVDFDPTYVDVRVVVTSTGKLKETAAASAVQLWDGAIAITAASGGFPAYVTLNNVGGTTDWATTDTLYVLISE